MTTTLKSHTLLRLEPMYQDSYAKQCDSIPKFARKADLRARWKKMLNFNRKTM